MPLLFSVSLYFFCWVCWVCCVYGDILPLGSSITRTDKLQALGQLQIALQRNGNIVACEVIACSGNRILQRRILVIANLSHHRVLCKGRGCKSKKRKADCSRK